MQANSTAALASGSTLNNGGSTGDSSTLNLATASSGYIMNALSIGGIMRFTGPGSGATTLTFAGGAAQGFTGGAATKKISVATNVNVVVNGSSFDILGATAVTNRNHTLQVEGTMTFNTAIVATGSPFTAGFTKTGAGVLTLNGGANTYSGDTTINEGTLALTSGSSIANTPNIILANNATIDVSAVAGFALLSSQTLSNSISGGIINGSLDASAGKISLASYTNGIPCLTVANSGTLTLAAGTAFRVNLANGGAGLGAGSYKLIAKGGSGAVGGTAPSAVTLGGDGLAGGATGSLSISNSELYLLVTGGSAPKLGVSQSGNLLTFTWSGTYKLQSQTNSLNVGLVTNSASWFDYPGGTVTGVTATIDPVNPAVFFRLTQ